MKQYYTDYPFVELGDKEHELAPMRAIKVYNYDGNKYCNIKIEGSNIITHIKACYIYSKITKDELRGLEEKA